MKNLTNVFYIIYKICRKKNIIDRDIEKEAITNAMDGTIAYYQPSDVQPSKELENLFYGIEYPKNKITKL